MPKGYLIGILVVFLTVTLWVLIEVIKPLFNVKPRGSKKMPTCDTQVKGAFRFIKFGTKMSDKLDKVREAYNTLEAALRANLKDNDEAKQAHVSLKASWAFASQSVRAEQIERNARTR